MARHYSRFVIAFVLLIAVCASAQSTPATQPVGKTVRVLAIGNSFSGNATAYLRQMAEAGGHRLVFGHAMISGSSFERHLKGVAAFEADADNPDGKPYKVTIDGKPEFVSLRYLLELQPWDFITVQQASILSYKPESFEPHASALAAYARRFAPQAKLLVHETWAYRADHLVFKNGFDQTQMYRRLHDNYAWIANQLGAVGVIPVGTAFQNVREDSRWQPWIKPVDLDAFKHPSYPPEDYELNVGYSWSTRVTPAKLVPDRGHASSLGRYLGTCVWYEYFFGDVRQIWYRPDFIGAGDAAFLREIAHRTVTDRLRPKAADASPTTVPSPTAATLPAEAGN